MANLGLRLHKLNLSVEINNVRKEENNVMFSMHLAVYFSMPITV
jgi:hypothetical protein